MTRVFVVLAKTFKKWILNPIRSLHLAPLVFGFMLEKRGGGVIAGFLISSSRSEPALSRVPVVGRKGLGQHHPRTWVLVGAISLKVDSERGWLRTREWHQECPPWITSPYSRLLFLRDGAPLISSLWSLFKPYDGVLLVRVVCFLFYKHLDFTLFFCKHELTIPVSNIRPGLTWLLWLGPSQSRDNVIVTKCPALLCSPQRHSTRFFQHTLKFYHNIMS